MNQSVDLHDSITKHYYPSIQKNNQPGKWMVMVYDNGAKGHTLTPYRMAIDKTKWNPKGSKKQANLMKRLVKEGYVDPTAEKAEKEEEKKEEEPEGNYPSKIDVVWVEDAKEEEDSTEKGVVPKAHHKAFTDSMKEAAKKYDRPVIGVLELLTKVFYVTFVPEQATWSDKTKKTKALKTAAKNSVFAFSTIRGNVKSDLSTTNADVKANDHEALDYEHFEKQGPKI